ncbi:MAG: hypothetical protein SOV36_03125 [Anaerostipes faecalis]|nr:hypothetical protein [Anaerostipes faecalis]
MMTMGDADIVNQMFNFDYTIQLLDLDNIPEAVSANADGSYTIFINSKLSAERQKYEALHALFHILEKDFEKSNVGLIEENAHKQI